MNVPKLRFKEFNDEWSFAKLSKISSEISYGMGLAAKEYDGLNKYIRITDIDETTNKYSNILKQTFVIWTSSNDKKTIENIINKFNYIDNPIEVDYINGVIKYDISATNFFSNIV